MDLPAEAIKARESMRTKPKVLEVDRFEADKDFRNKKAGQKCLSLYIDCGIEFMIIHMLDEGQDFEGELDINYEKNKIIINDYETTEYQVLTVGK